MPQKRRAKKQPQGHAPKKQTWWDSFVEILGRTWILDKYKDSTFADRGPRHLDRFMKRCHKLGDKAYFFPSSSLKDFVKFVFWSFFASMDELDYIEFVERLSKVTVHGISLST